MILPYYSSITTDQEFVKRMLSIGSNDHLFTTFPLPHCNAQQITVTGLILTVVNFVLYAEFGPERYWE